jgi:hypothetical protein
VLVHNKQQVDIDNYLASSNDDPLLVSFYCGAEENVFSYLMHTIKTLYSLGYNFSQDTSMNKLVNDVVVYSITIRVYRAPSIYLFGHEHFSQELPSIKQPITETDVIIAEQDLLDKFTKEFTNQ